MRILPSGTTAVLVELDELAEVLDLYAALQADPLPGVVDVVPAARTVLVVVDPGRTTLERVADAVRRTEPRGGGSSRGALVEIGVRYDARSAPGSAIGDLIVAGARLGDHEAIVLARRGGPEFLDSELARLRHLVALASSISA